MKLIESIVRPEKLADVQQALAESGFNAMTHFGVIGRGRQQGIRVGDVSYPELPKSVIHIVVDDAAKDEVIDIILDSAATGETGNPGDGRIFVVDVEESYTISSQTKDS
ncbi:MAG TPA: P-II family nitrogen regulator [Candidatus Nesterenkonia stercoripullorum]|uniref:P-II family nitrogen regulator n=1 Tax=Candidatus Nesterenkonia stercoripullorum TaxID=2838701 RepID=A0A9D1US02_9MICC|nr:P-II family nitrogen regulator [Candidatus Nesterenkonia stercoripullorum]